MATKLIDILGKSLLFSGFSPEQMEQAMKHLQPKPVTLKDFEPLYKKGEPANSCWLIQSGNLMVKRTSLRRPYHGMVYKQGATIGIQGLADPGTRRAVTMIADGKVKLVEITYEGISRLEKDTQILLWENISRLLLRKLFICLSQHSFDD